MGQGRRARAPNNREAPGPDEGDAGEIGRPEGSPGRRRAPPRWLARLAPAQGGRGRGAGRIRAPAGAPAPDVDAAALPPLRGLFFALATIGRVSVPLLAVMLAGRFLGAVLPAAALWVQRDLLNLLGTWVTQGLVHRQAAPAAPAGALAPTAAPPVHALLALLLALLLVNAVSFALEAASRAAEGHLREWVGHDVALRHHEVTTGADLERLELPSFWDRAQRTWNGSSIIESMDGTLAFASGLVTLAATLGVLLRVRWQIVPIVFVGALPSLWIGLRHARQNLGFQRSTESRNRHAGMLSDLLTGRLGALELRLFQLGEYLGGRWRTLAEAQNAAQLALLRRQVPANALASLVRLLAFGAAFAVVAAALVHGRAGVGDVVVVVQALPGVQGVLGRVFQGASHISYSGGYAAETEAFFRTARFTAARGDRPFPRPLRAGIRAKGLAFAYPGAAAETLRGVDLFIPAGETLALVGRNGAGKTTLVKLLLGLYRPTGGRIEVDGVDLLDIAPEALHAEMAAVFQDFTRFALTLRENVGFGDLRRLRDEGALRDALRRAGLDDLPDGLPQGLDTLLTKAYVDGTDLSGGQWQRVAIARALLRDAQVIALDEPTASLDPLGEVEVFRQFRELAAGRTTILVSHRLGIARLADRIAVLAGGRVIEYGTHAELLAQGGEYATMFARQAAAYAPAAPGGAVDGVSAAE